VIILRGGADGLLHHHLLSVARVEFGRKLPEAIWHMLTSKEGLRSGRPHTPAPGRMTTLALRWATGASSHPTWSSRKEAREG